MAVDEEFHESDFGIAVWGIERDIDFEGKVEGYAGPLAIAAANERRSDIKKSISALERKVSELLLKLNGLACVPNEAEVLWAQSLIVNERAVVLKLDTNGVDHYAELCGVTVTTIQGERLYSTLIQPDGQFALANEHYTGITHEQIAAAPKLFKVWDEIWEEVYGRIVLCYNLDFDRKILEREAQRKKLHAIPLVAESLMHALMRYLREERYPKMEDFLIQIDRPMPDRPAQTAQDRAMGMINVLGAMAQGIVQRNGKVPDAGLMGKDAGFDMPF